MTAISSCTPETAACMVAAMTLPVKTSHRTGGELSGRTIDT